MPALNVTLDFRIDGLSMLMSLLVLGVGGLILIYASGYMAGHPKIGRFFTILIIFMIAMLGVVTSNNIILLFVFWELTSISSYLLIGFNHESEKSQQASLQALFITGSGGLCLMAGLIMLGVAAESWVLSDILASGDIVRESSLYVPILVMVFLGCFTKSAQFPFHFWLPNAMAGPTPVSAYLHSATMVKAGIYLLARLNPVLGETLAWQWTLIIFGSITGLLGGWMAWQQIDLKRIMAYTTISALGILVFLLGLGETIGIKAMILFLLVHSLYKGAFFMVAGSVDHEAGTRDVNLLGGLYRSMPITFAAAVIAGLSMAGITLLGFVGKELIYEASVESHFGELLMTVLAFGMNFFNVAAAFIIVLRTFTEQPAPELKDRHVHEAPWTMWLGPIVLGLFSIVGYIFVESKFFSEELIGGAVSAVYGEFYEVHLHMFPSSWLKIVPILSIITIISGWLFYLIHTRMSLLSNRITGTFTEFGPEKGYFNFIDGVVDFATRTSKIWQSGYLRRYLLSVFLLLIILVGLPLLINANSLTLSIVDTPRTYELFLSLVIVTAAIFVATTSRRLAAVAALGVVGYGVALLYMYFNAPDLAMTQFSIETLTVIIFVLIFYRLPPFVSMTTVGGRYRDLLVATLVGVCMFGLVLFVTSVPYSRHISDYYAAVSYSLAKGQNIVNVILVDFRGFDTLIEISVLGVAAIGVYALIRGANNQSSSSDND
ncbi:MAG: hydrogen gas-evolving membrane-bound hydrogenase subunit E [Chloroflexota bacterium]